ncbi:unnamed protein product [Linum trigynum]|uniref:Uncharacterized protein n=1 Tax=Linum trigynum TaxID=586398 RepID=A0AAV2DVT0_9ROSI
MASSITTLQWYKVDGIVSSTMSRGWWCCEVSDVARFNGVAIPAMIQVTRSRENNEAVLMKLHGEALLKSFPARDSREEEQRRTCVKKRKDTWEFMTEQLRKQFHGARTLRR